MTLSTAVRHVNKRGMLLVFPQENRRDPPSLWYEFFPKSKMRWEWDENGDHRVSDLWRMRERLSTSRQVAYGKFFRGRATVVSLPLFRALLRIENPDLPNVRNLTFTAREVLDFLEEDSPLSTKQLKRITGLQGRAAETAYTRALKELWDRYLIVGFGEVDEGAFPSLAIGATKVLFEDEWQAACAMTKDEAEAVIREHLPASTVFEKTLRARWKKREALHLTQDQEE